MNEGREWLDCGFCGCGIRNNPEENVVFHADPYPKDEGYGVCRSCGGDPKANNIRDQMGSANTLFFDVRIKKLKEVISEKNRKHFDSLSYEDQCLVIGRYIKAGLMI